MIEQTDFLISRESTNISSEEDEFEVIEKFIDVKSVAHLKDIFSKAVNNYEALDRIINNIEYYKNQSVADLDYEKFRDIYLKQLNLDVNKRSDHQHIFSNILSQYKFSIEDANYNYSVKELTLLVIASNDALTEKYRDVLFAEENLNLLHLAIGNQKYLEIFIEQFPDLYPSLKDKTVELNGSHEISFFSVIALRKEQALLDTVLVEYALKDLTKILQEFESDSLHGILETASLVKNEEFIKIILNEIERYKDQGGLLKNSLITIFDIAIDQEHYSTIQYLCRRFTESKDPHIHNVYKQAFADDTIIEILNRQILKSIGVRDRKKIYDLILKTAISTENTYFIQKLFENNNKLSNLKEYFKDDLYHEVSKMMKNISINKTNTSSSNLESETLNNNANNELGAINDNVQSGNSAVCESINNQDIVEEFEVVLENESNNKKVSDASNLELSDTKKPVLDFEILDGNQNNREQVVPSVSEVTNPEDEEIENLLIENSKEALKNFIITSDGKRIIDAKNGDIINYLNRGLQNKRLFDTDSRNFTFELALTTLSNTYDSLSILKDILLYITLYHELFNNDKSERVFRRSVGDVLKRAIIKADSETVIFLCKCFYQEVTTFKAMCEEEFKRALPIVNKQIEEVCRHLENTACATTRTEHIKIDSIKSKLYLINNLLVNHSTVSTSNNKVNIKTNEQQSNNYLELSRKNVTINNNTFLIKEDIEFNSKGVNMGKEQHKKNFSMQDICDAIERLDVDKVRLYIEGLVSDSEKDVASKLRALLTRAENRKNEINQSNRGKKKERYRKIGNMIGIIKDAQSNIKVKSVENRKNNILVTKNSDESISGSKKTVNTISGGENKEETLERNESQSSGLGSSDDYKSDDQGGNHNESHISDLSNKDLDSSDDSESISDSKETMNTQNLSSDDNSSDKNTVVSNKNNYVYEINAYSNANDNENEEVTMEDIDEERDEVINASVSSTSSNYKQNHESYSNVPVSSNKPLSRRSSAASTVDDKPQNTQGSKLATAAISTLVLAAVTSVAISVYLEMLMIGVAVGAVCVIAAALLHYCTKPKSTFESNDKSFTTVSAHVLPNGSPII